MRRKTLPILFAFLLAGIFSNAQLADKAVWFGGANYQILTLKNDLSQHIVSPMPFFGLGFGMDYVLAHSNDQVSLGINPNANLSFSYYSAPWTSSGTGINFLGQVPVYFLARLGAGCTPYNEQKVGIGAGLGPVFSYMYRDDILFPDYRTGIDRSLNQTVVTLNTVVEFSINTRVINYLLRFNWTPLKYLSEYGYNGDKGRFGGGGFSVMYTF